LKHVAEINTTGITDVLTLFILSTHVSTWYCSSEYADHILSLTCKLMTCLSSWGGT